MAHTAGLNGPLSRSDTNNLVNSVVQIAESSESVARVEKIKNYMQPVNYTQGPMWCLTLHLKSPQFSFLRLAVSLKLMGIIFINVFKNTVT